jgi:hypothetical protein
MDAFADKKTTPQCLAKNAETTSPICGGEMNSW